MYHERLKDFLNFSVGFDSIFHNLEHLCYNGAPYPHYDVVKSKDENMCVPVGLWELEPEDELSLDVYEGYRYPHDSNLYDKIKVAGIMTYQMTSDGIYAPSTSYFNSILEGYRDFGLDTSYLYDSAGWAGYQSNQSDNVFGLEYV